MANLNKEKQIAFAAVVTILVIGVISILEVVKNTAEQVFIPLTVGGGIRNIDDMRDVILAGAEKVSVNSAAVLKLSFSRIESILTNILL